MRSTSSITINLSAIDRNIAALRSRIGAGCDLCAVVKADGYGLGAPAVATQLARSGVSMFAVYSLAQAEAIAAAEDRLPILVLMPVREIEIGGGIHRLLLKGCLHLTVHGRSHAQDLAAIAETLGGGALPVHLEVDTGMSRGGALPEEAVRTIALIADDRRLRLAGVFTHFSDSQSDATQTHLQMDRFDALVASAGDGIPRDAILHAANSHAVARSSRFHQSMVRVGLAWTGLASIENDSAWSSPLEPILSWESSIVHVKEIPVGSPVGYGSRWQASRPTRVGMIPVGYFDGYPMGGSDEAGRFVRIIAETPGGERSTDVPVLGAVNMDQIVVDLTDCPASLACTDGFIGMRAELYGADPSARNFLPALARAVGTHPYELLCRLHPRIVRRFAVDTVDAVTASAAPFDPGVAGAIAS